MTDAWGILLVLVIGILVAALMYYAYLKIIQPKRRQNNSDYTAYLWAAYALGFLDRSNARARRSFGGNRIRDRITVDGMIWYTNGYTVARDRTVNLAEQWLTGAATAEQKEIFYKLLQVFEIDEDEQKS